MGRFLGLGYVPVERNFVSSVDRPDDKPLAHTGQASNIQKFKDDTGLILRGGWSVNLV